MSGLISSVAWVRRGVASRHPVKYDLDDAELERVAALARINVEEAKAELARVTKEAEAIRNDDATVDGEEEDNEEWVDEVETDGAEATTLDGVEEDVEMDVDGPPPKQDPNNLSAYNLDDYDKPTSSVAGGAFSNLKGLAVFHDNDDDPYITLKEDDEDDERAELEILPTDNLIVSAKTEDDISQLEIHVYDSSDSNLYVHHDLMLPSFPLCLEWLDFPPLSEPSASPPSSGNYIAVGTMEPEIEIWSLDTVDALFPSLVLGRPDLSREHVPTPLGTGKKKKKKSKARKTHAAYHVDAVLSLSWNVLQRNLLASASADHTVKLWDLSRDPTKAGDDSGQGSGALRSFDVHTDKVQAVQWNPSEPPVLLSGSYDRTVRTFDTRSPATGVGALVGADVEALAWDPFEPSSFYVSLENGLVLNFDARNLPSNPQDSPAPTCFTLAAHDGATSALSVNPHVRGCLATGGTDKLVKVWSVSSEAAQEKKMNVSLVTSRDLSVGKVFAARWSPDEPLTLACAGSAAKLQVWDVGALSGARKVFGTRLVEAGKTLKEKEEGGAVVGVASDEEGTDNED